MWSILFSFFFLFYSISPLTYPLPNKEPIQRCGSAQQTYPDRSSFRVFLMEIILEAVSPSGNQPQGAESETVLIRKKRALIPENTEPKLSSFEPITITHVENFSLSLLGYDWLKTNINIAGTSKGFRLLYAGHSPPPQS